MYLYQYDTAKELLDIASSKHISIADIAIAHEAERDETLASDVTDKMAASLDVMRTNIRTGIRNTTPSIGGLIGQNAAVMHAYAEKGQSIGGGMLSRAISYALAITEENARMKRIVACPTAGASGVVPGCLIAFSELYDYEDSSVINALFTASAIGILIAARATVSGAEGGCQAEVGTASAMAAAGLVSMRSNNNEACVHAAAFALKNVLGLVCDPVAGLVEVPCSKRNVMGAANAIASADMAIAGIQSVIPLDEVIAAMKQVGRALPHELKETAKGGVAASRTGKKIKKEIRSHISDILHDAER